jgi:hypothetical protein
MGKKSFLKSVMERKAFRKTRLRSFLKSNRIVLAAIAGAAAGIVITRMAGSEKAKEMFQAMEGSVKNLSHKLMTGKHEAMLKMQKAS